MKSDKTSSRGLFVALMALIALGVLVSLARHGLVDLARLRAQRDAIETEYQSLMERNQSLMGQIRRLKHDPAVVEELARRELGLAKPGELVYCFRPQADEGERALTRDRSGSGP